MPVFDGVFAAKLLYYLFPIDFSVVPFYDHCLPVQIRSILFRVQYVNYALGKKISLL